MRHVESDPNPAERVGVLYLCVANSARSQMAEGFARAMAPAGVSVFSAGSAPMGVNPLAVQVMQEIGVDISGHRSKGLTDIPAGKVGTVVSLCAEEECPLLPGEVRRVHWPLPDPAAATGGREEMLRTFRDVRDQVRFKLEAFFGKPYQPVERGRETI